MSPMNKVTKVFLPILLIALALGIGWILVKTTQKPEKKHSQRTAYAVDVVALQPGTQAVRIQATGTVAPALEITLRARVAGEIIETAPEFIDGGLFKEGERILTIDPIDFELALEQKKAALAEAQFQLQLEQGQSAIAAREWELIETGSDATDEDFELATRVPHLRYRTAKLAAARAELEKAQLDLASTEVRAPFNAVVVDRKTDLGARTTLQDTLATLAGSDRFYVRASISLHQLQWIVCDPEDGSVATILRNTGDVRQGQVVRMESALEKTGRMARVLIAVDNPLQGEHPMLLNEYVRTTIEGLAIEAAYAIPRSALHDDRYVWLMTPESTLEIREVDVGWRDTEDVVVTGGVQPGEQLILTNLSTPVNGMKLRRAGDPMPEKKRGDTPGKGPQRHEP